MKTNPLLTLALSLVAPFAATAAEPVTQTCVSISKEAPFEAFDITYQVKRLEEKRLEIASRKVVVTARYAAESGSASEDQSFVDDKVELRDTDGPGDYAFSISDGGDWMSASIAISRDDAGTNAFVHFSSDGPSINGYYSCTNLELLLPSRR